MTTKLSALFKWSDGYPSIFDDEYLPQWKLWKKTGQNNPFDALSFWAYIERCGLKLLDKPIKVGTKPPTKRVTPDKVYYGFVLEQLKPALESKLKIFSNSSILHEFKISKTQVSTFVIPTKKHADGSPLRFVELSLQLNARGRGSLDGGLNSLIGSVFKREVPSSLRDTLTKAGMSKAKPRSVLPKCKQIQDKPNSITSPYGWTQLYYRNVDAFMARGSDGLLLRLYLELHDPLQIYEKTAHEKVFTEGVKAALRKLK